MPLLLGRDDVDVHVRGGLGELRHHHHAHPLRLDRYSTAGINRPFGLPPPRASFIRPARACSSKNTVDSTPRPPTLTGMSGTVIGTKASTPIRAHRLERLRGILLGRGVGQLVERLLDVPDPQLPDVELRVPVEGDIRHAHVAAIGFGDRLHDDRAVLGA